jgi:cytoskeletal protein CcmA (bactofilin family)
MAIFVMVILAFSIASLSVVHYQLVGETASSARSRELAESVVSQALAQILYAADNGTVASPEIHIHQPPDVDAWLTFNRYNPANVPWSTNNQDGVKTGHAYAQDIPPESVFLIGTAVVGGIHHECDALCLIGPYNWSIASAGNVDASKGGLLVSALQPTDDPATKTPTLPGGMAANGASLKLGPNTVVTGNVQCVGNVVVPPGAVVLGAVEPGAPPVAIPSIDIASYDPYAQGKCDQDTVPPSMPGGKLEGFNHTSGNLTVGGDLILDSGVLYVDGTLTVNGAVYGKGAIFATGNVQISSASSLATDNEACIVAGGNVSIAGSDKSSSCFQGLIMTGGNFNATNIHLVGEFVANGPAHGTAPGSVVTLQNVTVTQAPIYDFLSMTVTTKKVVPAPPSPTATSTSTSSPAASSTTTAGQPAQCQQICSNGEWYEIMPGPPMMVIDLGPNCVQPTTVPTASLDMSAPASGINEGPGGLQAGTMQDAINYATPASSATTSSGGSPSATSTTTSSGYSNVTSTTTTTSGATQTIVTQEPFTFSFNSFIKPSDSMQMLLWKVK